MSSVTEAYRTCEKITRAEARNFSYGIRLLPAQKRAAMSALYAFARRVDDIGDGTLDPQEKRLQLANVRADVTAMAAGDPPEGDAVLIALGDAMRHFPISVEELGEIITGCELDGERQRWESYAELEHYCTLVAGSVGRLSLAIFGTYQPTRGAHLANRLGIGLQITNILRDVVEDRETMGRVYLPQEDLRQFGCAEDASGPIDGLVELVELEVERARQAYAEGLLLLDLLDYRSRACVGAMAGIYHRLLERIAADPRAIFSSRVSLSSAEKVRVSLRALGGMQI